ncbi:putative polysaccharide deacetylase family protein [Desulforapulum autotrophicum HRM2]|uniref:Polysaccharide deacetylase family protein n=1 Tax=Desulforapulum autotrophicum (strain ATCC 43914 / DSM 3382 / VKM B-1955 / HRM2) TaxID=177437 RepID=C0QCM6_DESAH|nr:polysaccharide deacetylase family protein [Desulforapulum autotrophicum]ACN15103.1 putative polysaccharide deacetylase family protein [Desulforapulum autotrophicum HRM2]
MKPGVFLTFDVECSMGGAWGTNLKPIPPSRGMMGQYGDNAYGLPLICDILNRYDIKATFFLEPFNDELGYPGETEPICQYLVDHGQDVQLHIHPGHYHYGCYLSGKPYKQTDQIADLSPELQKQIIHEGADRLTQWTGKKPIAFRAGNMGASEQTLKVLPETGIWIDSSYTFPYVGGQCLFPDGDRYNGSKWYGDVLEVALSGFQQPDWPGLYPSKPVDLMGSCFEECRDAVQMICDAGGDAVLILHSFSLFKVKDKQYNGGKLNRIVARRFEKFCQWLNTHGETYPARTFSELGQMVENGGYKPISVEPCTINRPIRALTRKVIQGLNNFYVF